MTMSLRRDCFRIASEKTSSLESVPRVRSSSWMSVAICWNTVSGTADSGECGWTGGKLRKVSPRNWRSGGK